MRQRLQVALLLAVFLFSSLAFVNVHAASPIAFDSESSAAPCIANLGCSTLSWSHTVGAESNGILVVSVEVGVAPGHTLHTVSSIQYGTTALSIIGSHTASSGLNELEMWFLLRPTAGTDTITVTILGVDGLSGGAVSYSNVGGIVDFHADTGTQSPSTPVNRNTLSENLAVDVVYGSVSDTDPPTKTLAASPGPTQTKRWSLTGFVPHGSGQGADFFMGGSDQPASSPVTMTWSSTPQFDFWLLDAVALAPPTAEYGISLVAGWNLISLPLVPANIAIGTILYWQIAAGDFTVVWSYQAGKWVNSVLTAGKLSGPLTKMQDGFGYWIYMTKSDTLFVVGNVISPPPATPPTYSLNVGWNLVGFKPQPSVQSETVTQYLFSISGRYDVNNVWVYDNAAQSWIRATSSYPLQPGQAMWILTTSSATLRP